MGAYCGVTTQQKDRVSFAQIVIGLATQFLAVSSFDIIL